MSAQTNTITETWDTAPNAPRAPFGWNFNDLLMQFRFAQISGWITYWQSAAQQYAMKPETIMAVDSRESGCYWKTRGPKVTGDHDKAIGLGQEHLEPGESVAQLEDPEFNIQETARRLSSDLIEIQSLLASAKLSASPTAIEEMRYSAYNRGPHGIFSQWAKTGDASAGTENGNYGKDCLARETVFAYLLNHDAGPTPTGPNPGK